VDFSNILIRATNWVGDAVMCLPALRAIRDRFPEAHIAILAKPAVADLYARESCADEPADSIARSFCKTPLKRPGSPGWPGFRIASATIAMAADCCSQSRCRCQGEAKFHGMSVSIIWNCFAGPG
jgi:hypothetical protein